jgi:hypothetical protein
LQAVSIGAVEGDTRGFPPFPVGLGHERGPHGPEQHIDVDRPGELVGIDCFYVGRLRGTEGAIWQLTAIDVCSSHGSSW